MCTVAAMREGSGVAGLAVRWLWRLRLADRWPYGSSSMLSASSSSSRARVAAERGRLTGSFSSICMTSAARSTCTVAGSGGTASLTCATAMSTAVAPVNGRCPTIAS